MRVLIDDCVAKQLKTAFGVWSFEGWRSRGSGASSSRAGRYLRVNYVPDPEPDSVFVITGYDLGRNALRALRRRLKRKP